MGGFISRSAAGALKKNQENMLEMQMIQMERQIQMQNQMRERAVAMQIAKSRELFYWLGTFYILATTAMVIGFRRTRKPGTIAPLLPLSFIVAYNGDLAYGNKLHRIRSEAENIMQFEGPLLTLPMGLPTTATIDQGRERQHETESLRKAHDIFL